MKTILFSLLLAAGLTGCAGFTERLPYYFAIAETTLEIIEPTNEPTKVEAEAQTVEAE